MEAAASAEAGKGEEEGMNGDVPAPTEVVKNWECRIGFERKGRPGVMDIEVRQQIHS